MYFYSINIQLKNHVQFLETNDPISLKNATSNLRKARRLKIENHLTKKNLQAEGFFYVPR